MDTQGYTALIFSWLSSSLFWIFIIGGMVVLALLILVFKKHRALKHVVIEYMSLGRQKVNINTKSSHPLFRGKLKAGWFGNRTRFGGLWDYGPFQIMKTNDNREIRNVSSEDFHEINGRSAIIVQRSPENPKILVPINKVELTNSSILNSIAPMDLTGAGAEILAANERELKDRLSEVLQVLAILGVGVIVLFAIIMTYNYAQTQTTEANRHSEDAIKQAGLILTNAGQVNIDTLKDLCSKLNQGDVIESTAP